MLLFLVLGLSTLNGCAIERDSIVHVSPLDLDSLNLNRGTTQPAFPRQWWQGMGDPQLNQLIEMSVAQHPNMDIAAARIRAAEAVQRLESSYDGPFVDGQVQYDRQHTSAYGQTPAPLGGKWFDLKTLGLSLNYTFDFWGRTRHRVQAAAGDRLAVQAEAYDIQLLLETGVTQQYLEWLSAGEAREIAVRLRQQAESLLSIRRVQARAGLNSADVLSAAEVALEQAKQREHFAVARQEQALHRLAALTGQGPKALNDLKVRPLPQWRLTAIPLTVNLLANRPDVMASRWQAQAASERVKSAKAEFYPDISLSAFIGQSARQIGDIFRHDALLGTLSPALNLPIFHADQLNANLAGQTANYDLATAQYNQTVLTAAQDAADQLSVLNAAVKADQEAQQALTVQTKSHASVNSRYRGGLIGRLPWLQSQMQLDEIRLAASNARVTRLNAQISLVHALGGSGVVISESDNR